MKPLLLTVETQAILARHSQLGNRKRPAPVPVGSFWRSREIPPPLNAVC
jgi:hypothetical protein